MLLLQFTFSRLRIFGNLGGGWQHLMMIVRLLAVDKLLLVSVLRFSRCFTTIFPTMIKVFIVNQRLLLLVSRLKRSRWGCRGFAASHLEPL